MLLNKINFKITYLSKKKNYSLNLLKKFWLIVYHNQGVLIALAASFSLTDKNFNSNSFT